MMDQTFRLPATLLAVLAGAIHFITLPFLGNYERGGKVFAASLVLMLAWLLWCNFAREVHLPLGGSAFLLLWAVMLAATFQAFYLPTALLAFGFFTICLLLGFLVCQINIERGNLFRWIVNALLFTGVVAACLGLYEGFYFRLFGPSASMLIPYLLPPDHTWRIAGIYGQPNLFALLLLICLVAFFYRYLHMAPNAGGKLRTLRHLPLVLVALVFFLTGSRSGMIAFSSVFGFLIWLFARRDYLATNRREFITLLGSLAFAFVLARLFQEWGLVAPHQVSGRSLSDGIGSADARFVFWTEALLIFADHPWFGVGPDNFKFLQSGYGPQAHEILGFVEYGRMGVTTWAHNELLQILCEGGIFAFTSAALLLLLLIRGTLKAADLQRTKGGETYLYSHLFLWPFVIQSMFSWPLRHPPLLVLFFVFAGLLLSRYPVKNISFSVAGRRAALLCFFLGTVTTGFLMVQDWRVGQIKRSFRQAENKELTFQGFKEVYGNFFTRHVALIEALPEYIDSALDQDGNSLAGSLLPYAIESAALRNTYNAWSNVALLHGKLGQYEKGRIAIKKAIELQPDAQSLWDYYHLINILEASRKTGRPIEDFLPPDEFRQIKTTDFFNARDISSEGE